MSKMESKPKTLCVLMCGPDTQLDQPRNTPSNPLPIKCQRCGFPDIDYVPTPYLLTKGIWIPEEMSPAMRGNFLVRERLRQILEIAVPGACTFHPTADTKSRKATPWYLAEPNQKLKALYPPASGPLCPKCGAPERGDLDEAKSWKRMKKFDSDGVDVFKTLAWGTWLIWEGGRPARKDCRRDLYFSVRLEELLIRAKVKARMGRLFKEVRPRQEDERWIQEKLILLAEHGLVEAPTFVVGKPSAAVQRWFRAFLKRNAAKRATAMHFTALEAKHKLTLPQDYKEFIAIVGPKSFADVCDMEGSTTTVLPPQELDFKDYRRGRVPNLEGEDAEVDGVMFAANDGGDCFVFDVSVKGGDYPVFWYRHEENTMEPFAPNFAECIKRFAQRS